MIGSYDNDRVVVGKPDAMLRPYDFVGGRRPVIFLHGSGAGPMSALGHNPPAGSSQSNTGVLLRFLADEGWTIIAPDIEDGWGNLLSLGRVDAAVTRAVAVGCLELPPVLIGVSAGCATALKWSSLHPCAGLVSIIPGISQQAIRVANSPAGARAAIDLAHGVTYPAALPVGAETITITTGVPPAQVWMANPDSASVDVPAWATTVGADLHDVGALGHSNTAVGAVDRTVVASFLEGIS